MWHRVRTVFGAGFAAHWGGGAWPVAPLVAHGTIAAVLCGLASEGLPPFAYGIFALSVCGALVALPLLGDFGAMLRSDPAAEWVEALPVTRLELRLARTLLVLFSLAVLSATALLPAAFFAPDGVAWGTRAAFVAAGLGQTLLVAALLLGVQSTLGDRAEPLLVLFQTLLFVGIVLGFVVGLRVLPRIAHLDDPAQAGPGLLAIPPAWFATVLAPREATPLWPWGALPWIAGAGSLALLALAPLPRPPRARASGGWLAFALKPVRALATRSWLRPGERASFDLVFDALPLEREFVLRTYPLIGIPLAFLIAGSRSESGREGLLSVLLFTPAAYLPILLLHVPATSSPEARWILDTAPLPRERIAGGAIKAVALRFLLPLYAMLFLLAWSQAGLSFAARLALPAALLSMILLRELYPRFVRDPPLSVAPDAIEARLDWTGILAGLGIGLTLVAILAASFVKSVGAGLAVAAALLLVERALDRRGLSSA